MLDDLLETSSAVYHKRVAEIQLEAQKHILLLVKHYQEKFDAFRQQHPKANAQQAHSVYELQCMKEIRETRQRGRMQIAYEAKVKEQRDTSIQRFILSSHS